MGRYSSPIAGLIARLEYHTTEGQSPARMLDGFNLVEAPIKEVEGKKDLPSIRLMIPDFNEFFAPARNVDGKITVKLFVSTERSKGIANLMDAIDRVLDAIQTDANGNINALPGIARHFDCKAEEGHPTDVSLVAPIFLFLQPFKAEVGHRTNPADTGGGMTADTTRLTADNAVVTADAG